MAKVSIAFGVILIVVGLIGFRPGGSQSALLPAYVGIAMAICGFIALNPAARKHAMHAAVMVGLIGFLLSAGRLVAVLLSGNTPSALGFFSLGSMAVLTFIFVLLCVRSFIEARRKTELGTP